MAYQQRCSCNRSSCQVSHIIRESLQALDNLLLIQAELDYFQNVAQLLDKLCQDRNARFSQWERDQLQFENQLLDTLPKRSGGGGFSMQLVKQENIGMLRQDDRIWARAQKAALDQQREQLENAKIAHNTYLLEQQIQFVHTLPILDCLDGVIDIVALHLDRLESRVRKTDDQAKEVEVQLARISEEFQRKEQYLNQSDQQRYQAQLMGLGEIETRWFLHAIFDTGPARNRGESFTVLDQQHLTIQYNSNQARHRNFLITSKESWLRGKELVQRSKCNILQFQYRRWKHLRDMLLSTPTKDTITKGLFLG